MYLFISLVFTFSKLGHCPMCKSVLKYRFNVLLIDKSALLIGVIRTLFAIQLSTLLVDCMCCAFYTPFKHPGLRMWVYICHYNGI